MKRFRCFTFPVIIFGALDLAKLHGWEDSLPCSGVEEREDDRQEGRDVRKVKLSLICLQASEDRISTVEISTDVYLSETHMWMKPTRNPTPPVDFSLSLSLPSSLPAHHQHQQMQRFYRPPVSRVSSVSDFTSSGSHVSDQQRACDISSGTTNEGN